MGKISKEDILRENNTTDPNSITSLSLTHKALSNVSCLSAFVNLERLDLTFNNLSSLQGLEKCVNLKWLCVQQNELQSLKGIESLGNLTVFNAGKNKLRSMDEVKKLLKLRALILNDNEIATISGLDQLSELNTLVLSRNPICKMGNSLAKLKSIIKVSLSNCQLEAIDPSIKACTELEQLRLSHNDIKTLPAELGYNKKLQILDVGNNMLSRWSDLEALSSLHNLRNLNLLGNPIAEKSKLLKKINKLAPSLQIFNSKRLDQLNQARKNQKLEHDVADPPNNMETLKKKDSGERFMDVDLSKNAIQKDSKKDVSTEGDTQAPDEENLTKKAKKKREKHAEQETDKLEKDKKQKRKAEKADIDAIDDNEKSFMELVAYDGPEEMNSDVGDRKNRSVGKKDSVGAVVTYPAKNKKSKGSQTSTFELVPSGLDVGLGGPSAWDV